MRMKVSLQVMMLQIYFAWVITESAWVKMKVKEEGLRYGGKL